MARYWNYIKVPWYYEPHEFEFNSIKRGNRFYKPDFYLPKTDKWVEIKGYLSSSDKTKLRRFKKYYPKEAEKFQIVIYDPFSKSVESGKVMAFLLDDLKMDINNILSYKQINDTLFGLIKNWEV